MLLFLSNDLKPETPRHLQLIDVEPMLCWRPQPCHRWAIAQDTPSTEGGILRYYLSTLWHVTPPSWDPWQNRREFLQGNRADMQDGITVSLLQSWHDAYKLWERTQCCKTRICTKPSSTTATMDAIIPSSWGITLKNRLRPNWKLARQRWNEATLWPNGALSWRLSKCSAQGITPLHWDQTENPRDWMCDSTCLSACSLEIASRSQTSRLWCVGQQQLRTVAVPSNANLRNCDAHRLLYKNKHLSNLSS